VEDGLVKKGEKSGELEVKELKQMDPGLFPLGNSKIITISGLIIGAPAGTSRDLGLLGATRKEKA